MKMRYIRKKTITLPCVRCGGTGKIQGNTCYYCQGACVAIINVD